MESWSIGELSGHSQASFRKDKGNMRKLFLMGLLCLVTVTGCRNSTSLLTSRDKERADDPLYSSAEQKRRARFLHTYPDDDLAPRSGVERPPDGPHGK
jgi:hypothetical protein